MDGLRESLSGWVDSLPAQPVRLTKPGVCSKISEGWMEPKR